MRRYLRIIAALAAALIALSGGGRLLGLESGVVKPGDGRIPMPPVHAPEGSIVLNPAPDLTGMAINPLSGLYIPEENAVRRPFALVFNNNEASMPQSGLSQADIIYEVISEGTITRIIGIYQDFNSAKLGSIRSARHYFIDIALDYDAFFVHFGGSPQAYAAIKDLGIANINGIYLDSGVRTENFGSVVFWRDAERWKKASLREHSAFTSAESLLNHVINQGYRMEKRENRGPFAFYEGKTSPSADTVNKITVSYGGGNPGVFEYNKDLGKYYRSQFKGPKPHMDSETGEQISVDNVIVQLTSVRSIQGDTEGRRNVGVIGSGTGYLYTNGSVEPISWSKEGH
ncbi:MAG: DUF3048 domain-containing protein, partial [Clostridiales bacterium]|nr:DUF3048 domain-containing protein [Clostridiales bacterium]